MMEMEMRAAEDIEIGEDLTPPLLPLSFALHDSFLHSHCSCCFSSLPSKPYSPPPPFSGNVNYCSDECSASDFPLHISAAEFQLLQSIPSTCSTSSTADLRAALRLLRLDDLSVSRSRIAGLLSNREKLLLSNDDDDEMLTIVRDGGKAMAVARSVKDGGFEFSGESEIEEGALCSVLTNAVEVQDSLGRTLGIAVYGADFSWINHSCSPNACYRFFVSPPPRFEGFSGESRLRIVPGYLSQVLPDVKEMIRKGITKAIQGSQGFGPRVMVRSIKSIKRGEEVTIAYTNLLHPRVMRHSDLWLKYRFVCCCERCSAVPSTYVDSVMQVSISNLLCSNMSSNYNLDEEEETTRMRDYADDVVAEFLSVGDPKSCCEKLENMLNQGLRNEHIGLNEGNMERGLVLPPMHYVSLEAYTTLASAYKIRASNLLNIHSEADPQHVEAFIMSRISAAYSLLLAGAAHYLFCFESSLILSVANFWTSAGESLLNLTRSCVWNSPPSEFSSLAKFKCSNCCLLDLFKSNLFRSEAQNPDIEEICREFLGCVTNITSKVWSFLSQDCPHLELLKDPIDFSWVRYPNSTNRMYFRDPPFSSSMVSSCGTTEKSCKLERAKIFELSVHCLQFGGILARICYGEASPLWCSIKDILNMK